MADHTSKNGLKPAVDAAVKDAVQDAKTGNVTTTKAPAPEPKPTTTDLPTNTRRIHPAE